MDGPHQRPWHVPNSARRVCESPGSSQPISRRPEPPGNQSHFWAEELGPRHLARARVGTGLALVTSQRLILVCVQHPHAKLAELSGAFWLSIFSTLPRYSHPRAFPPNPKDTVVPSSPGVDRVRGQWEVGCTLASQEGPWERPPCFPKLCA